MEPLPLIHCHRVRTGQIKLQWRLQIIILIILQIIQCVGHSWRSKLNRPKSKELLQEAAGIFHRYKKTLLKEKSLKSIFPFTRSHRTDPNLNFLNKTMEKMFEVNLPLMLIRSRVLKSWEEESIKVLCIFSVLPRRMILARKTMNSHKKKVDRSKKKWRRKNALIIILHCWIREPLCRKLCHKLREMIGDMKKNSRLKWKIHSKINSKEVRTKMIVTSLTLSKKKTIKREKWFFQGVRLKVSSGKSLINIMIEGILIKNSIMGIIRLKKRKR